MIEILRDKKAERFGTLMLILTHECNLRCVYCYEDHVKTTTMDIDIARNTISKCLSQNDKFDYITIILFGGEPFLEFGLVKEICEWTWSKEWPVEYDFSFSTNGTVLDDAMKKWIFDNREKLKLVLSADGKSKSQNMNRSSSASKLDYNFFISTWDEPIVKMTISEKTLPYLYENVVFYHDMGFKFADCNMAVGIDWSDRNNCKVLVEQLSKLVDYYVENESIQPAPILDMDLVLCEQPKKQIKWCGVGKEMMTYDVDGKAYPCNYITPMSFKEEELKKLLSVDYTNEIELLDDDCNKNCYLYAICPTCYAADYSLTGDVKKKDKSICELVKIRAYFSALLTMDKIQDVNVDEMSDEEQLLLYKKIKAIKKILGTYEKIIEEYSYQ